MIVQLRGMQLLGNCELQFNSFLLHIDSQWNGLDPDNRMTSN